MRLDLTQAERRRPRIAHAQCMAPRWAMAGLLLAASALPAAAVELGPLTKVSGGDPFTGCTADQVGEQPGTPYPNTEIEPWIAANPAHPSNVLAGWQQDRWSDGGSRGLIAGLSRNGGTGWRNIVPGRVTKCEGGPWTRASDPWLDFSTKGVAYFMHLAFEPDLPSGAFGANTMLVTRSTDGGATWGKPVKLIQDPAGQVLNDKNSLTADPKRPNLAYAVWDRLQDFTLPPPNGKAAASGGLDAATRASIGMDGVEFARAWKRFLAKETVGAQKAPLQVFFEGPIYFSRTTDAGKTWEPGRKIYDPGPNETTLGNQIVVRPDGTLVNFFAHFLPTGVDRLELIRSNDKGLTWGKPTVATVMITLGSVTPDKQEPIRDAANLFDVAVDPSNGNLYAVLQDYEFHGVEEVAFLMSTDGGSSWSKPVRINQTPPAGNPLRKQAIIPSVEVGPGGVLVVTYYDFRNDNGTGELADYWAVFCEPAKVNCRLRKNWGAEIRLTVKSFDYLNAPIARGHFLGDYMGLERAGNAVLPAFGIADGENKVSVYTRRISVDDTTVVARDP